MGPNLPTNWLICIQVDSSSDRKQSSQAFVTPSSLFMPTWQSCATCARAQSDKLLFIRALMEHLYYSLNRSFRRRFVKTKKKQILHARGCVWRNPKMISFFIPTPWIGKSNCLVLSAGKSTSRCTPASKLTLWKKKFSITHITFSRVSFESSHWKLFPSGLI